MGAHALSRATLLSTISSISFVIFVPFASSFYLSQLVVIMYIAMDAATVTFSESAVPVMGMRPR